MMELMVDLLVIGHQGDESCCVATLAHVMYV